MAKALSQKEIDIFENLSVPRAVAAMCIPTVISQIVSIVYNIADTWYIGQLNNTEMLAAVSIAFPMFLMITAVANLFGVGGGSMLSRLLGARDYTRAKKCAATAVWGGVAVSAFYSAAVFIFMDPILKFLGADADNIGYARSYVFWTITAGGVPSIMNMVLAHHIRAEGASREASIGMCSGAILNIILDPIFMYNRFLGLGIAGAAMATCLSNLCATAYFIAYIYVKREKIIASYLPRDISYSCSMISEILAIGLPSSVVTAMSVASNCTLITLVSDYKSAALASVGLIKKFDMLPTHSVMGICAGIVPLMAYNYTAGNKKRVRAVLRFAAGVSMCITVPFLIMCEFSSIAIIRLFIENPETIRVGSGFLRLHCLSSPFLSTSLLVIAFFQAIGEAKPAVFISFLRKGPIDIPFMFLMNIVWPLYGIIAVQPIMDIFVSIVAGSVFMYYVRVKKIFL